MFYQDDVEYNRCNFSELQGETIVNIESDKYVIRLDTESGSTFLMFHNQDCCEHVCVEDICGDLNDLLHTPVIVAEEVTYRDRTPEGISPPTYTPELYQWTFYKMDTARGGVTIRWYGCSNGWYSVSVNVIRCDTDDLNEYLVLSGIQTVCDLL